ncbi:MAG: hypothetical protein ACLRPV_12195 [Lacrimispora saccharolytica]
MGFSNHGKSNRGTARIGFSNHGKSPPTKYYSNKRY